MANNGLSRLSCNRLLYAGGSFLIALILSACAGTPMSRNILEQQPPSLDRSSTLLDVPFFPQETYQCGPAALASILGDADVQVSPEALVPQVYLPKRQGTLQVELLATSRRYGRLPYLLEPSLEELLRQVKAGKPILVLQNQGLSWLPNWHYAVVIGYDLDQEIIILHSGTSRQYNLDLRLFERTWQRAEHWAFIALKPGELPDNGQESRYFSTVADFERSATPSDTIKAYQAGLSRWPDSSVLGMGLGNAYYQTGALVKAGTSYLNVLAHHADYAPAHNNLAQVLLEQGKLIAAKKHAKLAILHGRRHVNRYQSTLSEIESRISDH